MSTPFSLSIFLQGTLKHAWTLFAPLWCSLLATSFYGHCPHHRLGQWTKTFRLHSKSLAKEPREKWFVQNAGQRLLEQHGSILWLHFAGPRIVCQFQAVRTIYIIEIKSASNRTSASNRMFPIPGVSLEAHSICVSASCQHKLSAKNRRFRL